jgi:hypothetical protein
MFRREMGFITLTPFDVVDATTERDTT